MSNEQQPKDIDNTVFLVTGTGPGSGQTSIARFLAETFDIPRRYAGFTKRKLAHIYTNTFQGNWNTFSDAIRNDYQTSQIEFNEKDFDEDVLANFNRAIETNEHNNPFWNDYIDQDIARSVEKGGCVAEGKLAVVIDQITKCPELDSLAFPIIQILLLSPSVEVTVNP